MLRLCVTVTQRRGSGRAVAYALHGTLLDTPQRHLHNAAHVDGDDDDGGARRTSTDMTASANDKDDGSGAAHHTHATTTTAATAAPCAATHDTASATAHLLHDSAAQLPLAGLPADAFVAHAAAPLSRPLASGRVVAALTDNLYAVRLGNMHLTPVVELNARVYVAYTHGDAAATCNVMSGIVMRVNANGTLAVLFDNDSIDVAVPASMLRLVVSRSRYVSDASFAQVQQWLRACGVARHAHCEHMATVLYERGWRADKLYLLEGADVHCMAHIPRSVRMAVLDKAEWQREHHAQMRQLIKERVKERDLRYRLTKYSGVISASMAFLGIAFAFGWNFKKNYEQQRRFALRVATATLHELVAEHDDTCADGGASPHTTTRVHTAVPRDREEQWMRQVLRKLDAAHPRIVVLTGFAGCGKSTVCRAAIAKEGASAVHVDVYGADSALRGVVKALGVQNVDACGDLLDFVTEACQQYTAASGGGGGTMPLLVLKLREGSDFRRVYDEAVTLACGHKACHVIIEVPLESLTMADVALPRLDFYAVPNFSEAQAYAYTEHSIDPVAMHHFVRVAGTNSNDLDELYAAVHHRKMSATEYTSRKLVKAMRQVQAACAEQPRVRAALTQLAAFAFDEGQHAGVDAASLASAAVRDIVLYDPVRDRWLFRNTTLHTAVRCCA